MKARNRWIGILALVLIQPLTGATADQPLAPPADFVHDTPTATVRGSVARNRTTITRHAVPGSPDWSVPVWTRFYVLSPLADSILVLPHGGNLLGSREPDQVVMTIWYLDGETLRDVGFTLAQVMDPARMPSTASHYLWLESIQTAEKGWALSLADGRRITVTYR